MTEPLNQRLANWWDDKGWHYRRSLASRVAVLTALALGAMITLVSLTAYASVRMHVQTTLDNSLLERASAAASRSNLLSTMTEQDIPSWIYGASDVRIAFVHADGTVTTADPGPSVRLGAPELSVALGEADHSIRTVVAIDETIYRVAAVPSGENTALVLLQSLEDAHKTMQAVGTVLLVFGGAGVLAAALMGWAVARNGLRPVRRLTSAVEQIAMTQRLKALPVEGDDEVARLALAFNHMLEALSLSRARQRELIADAGHELRTPLTSLRTNIDLLSMAGDNLPPGAREELLADVRAQLEEFTTLIGDLVELSRDEPIEGHVSEFDLADVLEHAVAKVQRRAPDVDFVVVNEQWLVRGEEQALERAVTNLLDNAAKWSPMGGTVRVTLMDGMLTVDDEGPGIPEEDRPKVFDRFYRSPDARALPGSGLGLSIVAQAAARHSGTVRADESPSGGARLLMFIPGIVAPYPARV